MDKGRLLLRFRTLLTRISDQLGEKEVKSIAYIYGLAEPGSALDLLQALERRGSFSFDRPQQLVELLEGAHRFDIVSTCGIKEYVEDVAAPIGPGRSGSSRRTCTSLHAQLRTGGCRAGAGRWRGVQMDCTRTRTRDGREKFKRCTCVRVSGSGVNLISSDYRSIYNQ